MDYIRIKRPNRKTSEINPGGPYFSAYIEIEFIPGKAVALSAELRNSHHTMVKKGGFSSKCSVHVTASIELKKTIALKKKVIETYINVNVPHINY